MITRRWLSVRFSINEPFTCCSLAFAIVLWLNQSNASFEDLKDNFKLCVIYNVIMLVVGAGILGLMAVSPALGLLPAIGGLVLSFKLLMNWFDLSFFGAIGVSIVASFIQSYFSASSWSSSQAY